MRRPLSLRAETVSLTNATLELGGVRTQSGGEAGGGASGGVDSGLSYTYREAEETERPVETESKLSLPWPLTVLHNTSSWHSLPAFAAEVTAAFWREAHAEPPPARAAAEAATASYSVFNHPLPLTPMQELTVRLILAVLSALFVLIPFCYVPAAAAVFVVKERAVKAKHLQLVSGAGTVAYWAAAYLWDCLMYLITALAVVWVFRWYDEPGYVGDAEQASATTALLCLYGATVLPLVYCASFTFESHTTAQIGILLLNLVTGFVAVIAHQVMSRIPSALELDDFLLPIYRLFPPYLFGEALLNLSQSWYQQAGFDAARLGLELGPAREHHAAAARLGACRRRQLDALRRVGGGHRL